MIYKTINSVNIFINIKLICYLNRASLDVEIFLELNDEGPFILVYLISEMFFQKVDGLPGDQRYKLILCVKVSSWRDLRISSNLNSHTSSSFSSLFNFLVIGFYRLHHTNLNLIFVFELNYIKSYIFAIDTNGRAGFEDSFLDVNT